MAKVKFDATDEELAAAERIAVRTVATACAINKRGADGAIELILQVRMDLIATHANGCPLDFARLEHFDDLNLFHDICGIGEHLNRETGELMNMFRPRSAQPVEIGAQ